MTSWCVRSSSSPWKKTGDELAQYLAGTYGALQDVEDYYSDPPRILTVSTLAGDREDLALTLHILLAASHATNRSFLPPLMGTYLGPTDIDDGIVRGPDFTSISVDSNGDPPHPTTDPLVLHRRFFWSLFRPSVLEAAYQGLRVLEPNFLTHSIRTLLDRGEIERAKELNEVAILDLRPVFSFEMLVEKLREPLFARARVVRISTDEGALSPAYSFVA